jgi:hypothetical protein
MADNVSARALGALAFAQDSKLESLARKVFLDSAKGGVACPVATAEFKVGYMLKYAGLPATAGNVVMMAKWRSKAALRPAWWNDADIAARKALQRILTKLGLKTPNGQGGARAPKGKGKGKAPVAKPPVAEPPMAEPPTAKAPVAETPVAEAPVAKAPAAEAPKATMPNAPTLTIPKVTTAKGWETLLRDMAAYLLQAAAISPKKPTAAQLAAIRALAPKAD